MRFTTWHVIPQSELATWLAPRDDEAVAERALGDNRFESASGPFARYERAVSVDESASGDGLVGVRQQFDVRLAAPFWGLFIQWPFRWRLAQAPGTPRPWWFWTPGDRLEPRESTVLSLLCCIAVVAGYLGTLITRTISWAADEFGTGETAQGATLSAIRLGVLFTAGVSALADRRGRRTLLAVAATASCIATVAGAVAPNMFWLGASQTVARGFAAGLTLLIGIVSAEEMPRNSRAYAFSLITMTGALGAGMCVWFLPLADTGETSWRILYVLPIAGLPLIAWVHRRLPETRRFARAHIEAAMTGHGRRFWLLATTGFLLAAFASPASQFQGEFLREHRGFSGLDVSLFVILTSTPGGLAIIVGGRMADARGRRLIGALGIIGGTLLTVATFASGGLQMWAWAVGATMIAALVVPALGVYRPELFPTSLRGKAAGIIEAVTLVGSASGLLLVGRLVERWGTFATPMAILAVPSLLAALVVLLLYPETAHHSLEDLNPEDQVSPAPSP